MTRTQENNIPIKNIVETYSREAKKVFGNELKAVILYGSYARGDYEKDSDIDLMILLDTPQEQLSTARKRMRPVANALDMEYDCVISAVFQSFSHYEDYKTVSLFYQNIEKDGVLIG